MNRDDAHKDCDDCRDNPFFDRIQAFLEEWPDAEFGPAHIVLSDFNTDTGFLQWCSGATWAFEFMLESKQTTEELCGHSLEEIKATYRFLEELMGGVSHVIEGVNLSECAKPVGRVPSVAIGYNAQLFIESDGDKIPITDMIDVNLLNPPKEPAE